MRRLWRRGLWRPTRRRSKQAPGSPQLKYARTLLAAASLALGCATPCVAQLVSVETADLNLVYIEPVQTFLAPHVGRSFQNALKFHTTLFDYKPKEKITVL